MDTRYEQKAMKINFSLSLFFGLFGLIWGILIQSQAVVLDGIYASIGIILSALGIYTTKKMSERDDDKFPFGKSQMEPLLVLMFAATIIAVCLMAFAEALSTFLSGGREINPLSPMLYSIISVILCSAAWFYMSRVGRYKVPLSNLIKAEAAQYGVDTMLSLAIMLGFFSAYIARLTGYGRYSKYMDSLIVMIVVLILIRLPAVNLLRGIRDLLLMTPGEDVYSRTSELLKKVAYNRQFPDFVLRIGKGGKCLYYSIVFIAKDADAPIMFKKMDDIREEINKKLHALFENPIWLDISFTHDVKLTE